MNKTKSKLDIGKLQKDFNVLLSNLSDECIVKMHDSKNKLECVNSNQCKKCLRFESGGCANCGNPSDPKYSTRVKACCSLCELDLLT